MILEEVLSRNGEGGDVDFLHQVERAQVEDDVGVFRILLIVNLVLLLDIAVGQDVAPGVSAGPCRTIDVVGHGNLPDLVQHGIEPQVGNGHVLADILEI